MFKNKENLIGAHQSFLKNSQLDKVILDMNEVGSSVSGFYISNSRAYIKTWKIDRNVNKSNHKNINKFIVHSPLVGNLASTDKITYEKTIKSYIEDIKRMNMLNLKLYNFHPGSNENKSKGIELISNGINKIISETDNIVLLLETTVKKGNTIGSCLRDLSEIISKVSDKKRIGITIDTCHVWDAGYDLKNINKFLKEFDKIIGLKYLKAMHINDSKNARGSNKDRHELIGKGEIGLKP